LDATRQKIEPYDVWINGFRQQKCGSKPVIDLLSVLQWVVKIILVGLIVPLISASVTGYDQRTYRVLPPKEIVQIAGIRRSVEQLAAKYQPAMFLRSTTPSPPLLWVWYEAVPNQSTLDFVYYHAWQNEIHPKPIIHALYSIYRAAYYGYPLYDIEYFQVSVSRATGEVVGLRFETSPGHDYFAPVNEHLVAQFQRNANGTFKEERLTLDGNLVVVIDEVPLLFNADRVLVGVQSWNHLSRLLAPADQDFDITIQSPLKSLGDHQTREIRWKLPAAVVANLALIGYPIFRTKPYPISLE
jgi:hypothetical protein